MTIEGFFRKYPKTAVAFSGGTDSSYLLYSAKKYAQEVKAYYVKSSFQPYFEMEDALRLCRQLDIPLQVLEVDILACGTVAANPPDRCYHCKKQIFTAIRRAAAQDHFEVLLDGTNASDNAGDRPGMQALQELAVLSPLRICGLTKDEIRLRSKEAGLFTWDKPAYACLATRIPAGEAITAEKLQAVEASETFLASLGLSDFRVRTAGSTARLEVREEQLPLVLENRQRILDRLRLYYSTVVLNLECRK